MRDGLAEDAQDAQPQGGTRAVPVERHGEARLAGPLLLKVEQGAGVDDGVGADLEREVVAAELAFVAQAAADPPHGGMEEEDRFREGLHEVPEEVRAADVGELVSQDDFQFVGA